MWLHRSLRVLNLVVSLTAAAASGSSQAKPNWPGTTVTSPDGKIKLNVTIDGTHLRYAVTLRGSAIIESSSVGIMIGGVNLADGVEPGTAKSYKVDESYPSRGVHSIAHNRCNGVKLALRHLQSRTDYTLELRAYNDGAAFRLSVPARGQSPRIPDEATSFTLPAGSTVWYHGFRGHYEGRHARKSVSEIQPGEWAAPPLTFQLSGNKGYGSITEAALINFSGMGLEADGKNVFLARLGHAQPPSYPFTLRYGDEEAKRLSQPAAITGEITTPWRVILAAPDLNTLVNSDIISNLNPLPDSKLFPQGVKTEWVKPGRAVWRYIDDKRPGTVALLKQYTDMAHELGFEFNVVEGFWSRWDPKELRDFVSYSKSKGVRIFLWKHSKELRDANARHDFFQMCHELGVAGAKIDFFDHEAKEVTDLYNTILRETAELGLLVNFHGANKPTGESRTWPNELTREAVAGMESRGQRAMHDATLPFTRFLAGPADYTPLNLGARREDTTWAHQIATAVVFTSPLLTYGLNPEDILKNPAVDIIKSIPATWDETIVLPDSQIGELALFARRSGSTWFLAAVNGTASRKVSVPLSFLNRGDYKADLARDGATDDSLKIENSKGTRSDSLTLELRAGGGFVGRFSK